MSDLPPDTLPFLRPSRYCETELLSDFAWANFGAISGGWAKVQAICDFVHQRLRFSYPQARPTRTASEALAEGVGVCRDFTHLAVALCRCLNIPARYCNGYLGDIGVPADPAPMDFNAWFEVFLGDRWFTFDARHNQPRIGRILIARGRDAADIPMIATFGSHRLSRFTSSRKRSRNTCPSRPDRCVPRKRKIAHDDDFADHTDYRPVGRRRRLLRSWSVWRGWDWAACSAWCSSS